jgi:hypothetical protein
MDWGRNFSDAFEYLVSLQVPPQLGQGALLAVFVLFLALFVSVTRNVRLRRELAERAGGEARSSTPASWEDQLPTVSLEGEGHALVDRLLPRRPRNFLLVVAVLSAGCWLLGLALAENSPAFLQDGEWQAQPFYFAAHFVTLRLFATAFSRTFLAGITHLEVPPALARHRMWFVVGPIGVLIALALAVPFCVFDYNDPTRAGNLGPAAGLVLFATWCVEWFLLAFIWVMVGGYVILSRWVITTYRFRDPIEVVLHERRYRPFLQMSAQGATIVLGFWIINLAYLLYTGALFSDIAGAVITLVLVVAGFLPPLLQLKAKVRDAVDEQMANLRRRLSSRMRAEPVGGDALPNEAGENLREQLDEALVFLRISYLERLYAQLGQSETMDIVIKMLVPATTMAWYAYKYYKEYKGIA